MPYVVEVDGTPDVAGPAACSLTVQPNPFNPRTTLTFTLAGAQSVRIAVHDLAGRRVATLAEATFGEGEHRLAWDAAGLPSGSYVVRMEMAHGISSTKVTLLQ